YAYGQGFETADGWANLYPSVYRDLWLRAIAPVMSQLPVVRNIFDPAVGRPQDHYIFLGAELISPGIGALPGASILTFCGCSMCVISCPNTLWRAAASAWFTLRRPPRYFLDPEIMRPA